MFRNYLTIALRNLLKQRFYTFINIFGLAIGIASCLVIVLFVAYELGYDKYHDKASRIYRVNGEIKFGVNHYRLAVASAPFGEALATDFPEIETYVRFRDQGSFLVKAKETDTNIKEDDVVYADSTYFKVFSTPIIEGDPNTALNNHNSVAISQSIARKYFPSGNPIGQTLILDNKELCKVTAVYRDMPDNGHFKFDILISMTGWAESRETNFLSNNFNTYVLLRPGSSADGLQAKFPQFVAKHFGPQLVSVLGSDFTLEKFKASGNILEYTLMPLTDIHLHSDRTAELAPNGDITYVYLFTAVALFILIIACINFMNLSTARSANRAKEVGVRKVMGSMRAHLVRQFLTESILVCIGGFSIAVALAYLALPLFNDLSQKSLSIPFDRPIFYILLFAGALVVGFLSGIYPSMFLSAFKPVDVLKGKMAAGMKSGLIRSSLVVFQFTISILLVIATLTVQRQLNYIQEKKIGFQKDQVIIIKDAYALGDRIKSFMDEGRKLNYITSATLSGFLPVTGSNRSDNTYWPEGKQPTQENLVGMQTWRVDHDYLKTFGMTVLQGRFFSEEFPSDSGAIVINQSAAQKFDLGSDPLGKRIATFGETNHDGTPDPNSLKTFEVIGVVEDFHFESLKQNITPLAFFLQRSTGLIAFRFDAKDTKQVISDLEHVWKNIASDQPFQYSFLDEDFGHMYSGEQRLGRTFVIFAALAIVIACLGLFALTSFTAEQRTKEIGIRKVLGASVGSIVVLLSTEFGKLIIIAFVIAAPAAWFGVQKWLEGYTYKVEIGVSVYVLAGLVSLTIAWLTMSFQSIRAASASPAKALKSE
ncbi:ABC transporter permease [Chryseolinea sp. T2]|uniref:ABC transporter permease n=1 Tax=Chryseolinea sp. T2 TaxID=3129255 RepID=UPI003078702C